jgi:sugar/nucleoside kinase (ribokinase family)
MPEGARPGAGRQGEKSVLCIGQLVADVVVRPVDALPHPGRTDLVEDLQVCSGGCAANTAAVLAKLGAEVRLAALIGRDVLGEAALADLKPTGLGLEAVVRDPAYPTSAVIVLISSAGERSFIYRNGGNEKLANRHLPDAVLQSGGIIHVGGALKMLHLDLEELFARAKTFGATTSLDTDWDPNGLWMKRLGNALAKTDYLITNQEEAAMLAGKEDPREAARELLAWGARVVIVKRGEQGSMLFTKGTEIELPAYRVAVRDTTCAGDSFVAGFLFGLSRGRPLAEAMRLGHLVQAYDRGNFDNQHCRATHHRFVWRDDGLGSPGEHQHDGTAFAHQLQRLKGGVKQ